MTNYQTQDSMCVAMMGDVLNLAPQGERSCFKGTIETLVYGFAVWIPAWPARQTSGLRVMLTAFHGLIETGLILRVLLHANREPSERLTWIIGILVLPAFGILTCLVLGEERMRPRRLARHRAALAQTPPHANLCNASDVDGPAALLFRGGQAISGLPIRQAIWPG